MHAVRRRLPSSVPGETPSRRRGDVCVHLLHLRFILSVSSYLCGEILHLIQWVTDRRFVCGLRCQPPDENGRPTYGAAGGRTRLSGCGPSDWRSSSQRGITISASLRTSAESRPYLA